MKRKRNSSTNPNSSDSSPPRKLKRQSNYYSENVKQQKNSNLKFGFNSIYEIQEIFNHIIEYCNAPTLCSLSQTSRDVHKMTMNETLWENLIHQNSVFNYKEGVILNIQVHSEWDDVPYFNIIYEDTEKQREKDNKYYDFEEEEFEIEENDCIYDEDDNETDTHDQYEEHVGKQIPFSCLTEVELYMYQIINNLTENYPDIHSTFNSQLCYHPMNSFKKAYFFLSSHYVTQVSFDTIEISNEEEIQYVMKTIQQQNNNNNGDDKNCKEIEEKDEINEENQDNENEEMTRYHQLLQRNDYRIFSIYLCDFKGSLDYIVKHQSASKALSHLRRLEIESIYDVNEPISMLINHRKLFPSLRHIYLGCDDPEDATNERSVDLNRLLEAFPKLHILETKFVPEISNPKLSGCHRSLRTLYKYQSSPTALKNVLQSDLPNLEQFYMKLDEDYSVSEKIFHSTFSPLHKSNVFPNLESLGIVSQSHMLQVLNHMKGAPILKRIEILDLRGVELEVECMNVLVEWRQEGNLKALRQIKTSNDVLMCDEYELNEFTQVMQAEGIEVRGSGDGTRFVFNDE